MERSRPTIDEALKECDQRNVAQLFGISVDKAPENLGELRALVASSRNDDCEMSRVIDGLCALISASDDPDYLVRQLPYDAATGDLMFILLENPNAEERR